MWAWLNTYASAIQAITAVVGAAATIVLVYITARYVVLTKKMADIATAQSEARAEMARVRRRELRASINRLDQALKTLPVPSQQSMADTMVRTSIGWSDFDFGRLRSLAAEVSDRAGERATVVESCMNVLADQVNSVRSVPVQGGYDWGKFPWEAWNRALMDARFGLDAMREELG